MLQAMGFVLAMNVLIQGDVVVLKRAALEQSAPAKVLCRCGGAQKERRQKKEDPAHPPSIMLFCITLARPSRICSPRDGQEFSCENSSAQDF